MIRTHNNHKRKKYKNKQKKKKDFSKLYRIYLYITGAAAMDYEFEK